jgi:hypothetical protein
MKTLERTYKTPLCPCGRRRIYKGAKECSDCRSDALRLNQPPKAAEYCSVPFCEQLAHARSLCKLHYNRFRQYGDPLYLKKPPIAAHPDPRTITQSPTELGRILGVSRQRAEQILHKERDYARKRVASALRSGELVQADRCRRCGTITTDLEAHHWDYRDVLDVLWLCIPCHNELHPHAGGAVKVEVAA